MAYEELTGDAFFALLDAGQLEEVKKLDQQPFEQYPLAASVAQEVTPKYEWERLGTAYNPDPLSFKDTFTEWDTMLRQGEYGAFRFDFKVFPDFGKSWTKDRIDGILESKGVKTWKPSEWDGDALVIYFVTGIAPLIIAVIILGALAVVAAIIWAISFYKLKKIEVVAQTERAAQQTEASIARQETIHQSTLEAITQLPTAQEQIEALLKVGGQEREYATSIEEQAQKAAEETTSIFKTPLIAFAVMAGIGIIVFAFLQVRR